MVFDSTIDPIDPIDHTPNDTKIWYSKYSNVIITLDLLDRGMPSLYPTDPSGMVAYLLDNKLAQLRY